MSKTKRIMLLMLVLVFAISAVMTGCGQKEDETANTTSSVSQATTAEQTEEPLKNVELVYYFVNTPQKDIATVNEKLNELVKAKINATVKLNLIDWGSYDQKMNVVAASGEAFDLCFTGAWPSGGFNYFQQSAKGVFKPLNELLDKYAPDTKAAIPEMFLKAATIKGNLYGVPNFQQATAGYGYSIQKSIADKYKIDWKSVKNISDLTPFLETIKKNEPNLVPFGISKKDELFRAAPPMFGMEAVGDAAAPGWIYLNDNSLKVVDQYDSPEFKAYIKMMRDWFNNGYLRKDVATLKDMEADKKAGKNATQWTQIDIDTNGFESAGMPYNGRMSIFNKDVPSYDYQFVKPVLTTDKADATLTAIPEASKNPERAMMFINLLNTDKEIYNTLCWGVEGKHYKKVADNRIETNKDGGFQIWSMWEFGNMENSFLSEGDPVGNSFTCFRLCI
ncbi:MAG: transporter substrate-binding protein [Sporomusa sp.]|nr:transporter substrate-binding protein [Sporomusa sp.]